jgi:hypothetical protein
MMRTMLAKTRDDVGAFIALDDAVEDLRSALERKNLDAAREALGVVDEMTRVAAPSISVAEAAKELGVSRPTVKDWLQRGLLRQCGRSPLRLDFRRTQEVRRQVNELRLRQGDRRRLVRALELWADTELLRRTDVTAGIREGLADETVDMPPLD